MKDKIKKILHYIIWIPPIIGTVLTKLGVFESSNVWGIWMCQFLLLKFWDCLEKDYFGTAIFLALTYFLFMSIFII